MKTTLNSTVFMFLVLINSCSQADSNGSIEPMTNEEILLFENSSQRDCELFSIISSEELIIENNTWNAINLSSDSYEQCIYKYTDNINTLLGWKWKYPNDAKGVNAFPQLIYGWKPWLQNSTTEQLPKKISTINKLKVTYDVSVIRNEGDYNLAFDNWINSSSTSSPQNILFEFMIWEDSNNLTPFGVFIEEVTTTNGTYRFYMGEPDWEPEGSNWTYLAFNRISGRQSGIVDIDELLKYLIETEIISGNSYLASIEFGNEVGNSEGSTIINNFEVDSE